MKKSLEEIMDGVKAILTKAGLSDKDFFLFFCEHILRRAVVDFKRDKRFFKKSLNDHDDFWKLLKEINSKRQEYASLRFPLDPEGTQLRPKLLEEVKISVKGSKEKYVFKSDFIVGFFELAIWEQGGYGKDLHIEEKIRKQLLLEEPEAVPRELFDSLEKKFTEAGIKMEAQDLMRIVSEVLEIVNVFPISKSHNPKNNHATRVRNHLYKSKGSKKA